MERATIRVSEEFAAELVAFMQSQQYENRSEAIRDLARLGLKTKALEAGADRGDCVATFSYVFDHHLANSITAERGVVHGALGVIPVSAEGIGNE